MKDYYEVSGSDTTQIGWIEVSGERSKLKALLSIFGRETPLELDFSQINKQN